ncbi:MAG: metallophosphoesterase [Prevotella sp.]|nr:metallophosphoesterase [Prevotella sp.]
MIAFTLLPLLAIAYIGWHLWVMLPLAVVWRVLIIATLLGAFLLLFLNFGRRFDTMPLPLAQTCYEVSTSSVFVLLYIFMLFLALDLGRLVRLVPRSWVCQNGTTALVLLVVVVGIFVYGNLHYRQKERVTLQLTTEKPLARSYRLVMLSDLHLGYHNPRKELGRWIDLINSEKPDLILIAGDIIDGSMRPLLEEQMAEEFRRLSAPVYACLGNHEYYAGEPKAQQFYRDAGIRLLIDETALVDSAVLIVGRDDRTNRRRMPIEKLVTAAREGQSGSTAYTIVLDHQPYHLEKSEAAGVDFQLSGHTHRGQVWPISWITDAIYECSWGSHQRGNTRYYITSGIGIWGGKFRIGTQSEYVVAELSNPGTSVTSGISGPSVISGPSRTSGISRTSGTQATNF